MGNLRGSEWLILALVVILLFGAKKLPDAARGLGRSLRIFKSEIKQPDSVDEVEPHGATVVTPAAIVQAPVAPPVVQAPVQAPLQAPVQAPVQAAYVSSPTVPTQAAPVVSQPTAVVVDDTSVQSVNERFYGQEKSEH